jgi:oligoribonuclease
MLAWMDLEMTGLDPNRHVIVEIATLITDDDLNPIAEGPDIVVRATDEELAAMDDVVRTMHGRSGLLAAIRSSEVDLAEAGRATLDFLRSHIPEAGTVPLCGNSIGTDRRFLARWLPEIDQFLHYRSIDVSTVKELARRWFPEAHAAQPRKVGSHRAMGDVLESVAELAYYRESIFRTPTRLDLAVTEGGPEPESERVADGARERVGEAAAEGGGEGRQTDVSES